VLSQPLDGELSRSLQELVEGFSEQEVSVFLELISFLMGRSPAEEGADVRSQLQIALILRSLNPS